jgi:hypothetical protein
MALPQAISASAPPSLRFSLGVVGHRAIHPAFAANSARIETTITAIFDAISAALSAQPSSVRLHTLLVDGVDQMAAHGALARGWELVAPLPFGRTLNAAINAHPETADDARALLSGRAAADSTLNGRAQAIRQLCDKAHVFALADGDDAVAAHFLAMLDAPEDKAAARRFAAHCSERAALAGRVLIEQSDLLIGVWDGASRAFVGGTGHTIAVALEMGAPVVWIDPNAPENWRILRAPESLANTPALTEEERTDLLDTLVRDALHPPLEDGDGSGGADQLAALKWRKRSNPLFEAYRRVEALFSGEPRPFRSLRQVYEPPEAFATGSGACVLAAVRALPGGDPEFTERMEMGVLRRFAWADGISTHFSDLYRGGMIANFLVSGLAIVAGIAYLPFVTPDQKWPFALAEFLLLASILAVIALGRRWQWHARWFETRRMAEYLRHSPILLALGAARAPGRWPKGMETSWPEYYVRQSLREVGLPRVAMTQDYLRAALCDLLDAHVVRQRDYHEAKAARLETVHNNLDHLSGALFVLAVISVATYLVLRGGGAIGILPDALPHHVSKLFSFLGVFFPTFGATIAGIRYFGDFERFAAISEVTAEKLEAVHQRAQLLLGAPASALDYGAVADLAHAADDIVVSEIENWQAVFGGKHITIPV